MSVVGCVADTLSVTRFLGVFARVRIMSKKGYAVAAARMIEANPKVSKEEIRQTLSIAANDDSVVSVLKKFKEIYEKSLETGYAHRQSGNKVVSRAEKIGPEHRAKYPIRCAQFEQLIELFGGSVGTGQRGAKPFDILSDF